MCELCDKMNVVNKELTEKIKNKAPNEIIIPLRKQYRQMAKEHPKCAGCGILFGDSHIESPHPSPIGDLCYECRYMFEKQGQEAFVARIPRSGYTEEDD